MASASILTSGKALYAYNGTEWVPLNTSGNLVNSTRWQKVLSASATVLSGNDDTNESLSYTPGFEQVFLNGVLLARDLDYTATNGTTVTAASAILAGNLVEIIAYNNINVGNTYTQGQIDNKIANTFTRWVKTLSASATTLSGLDDNAVTLDYTAGAEQVYVNGILLLPSEYTATSGSTVVLSEAAVSGDVIQVHTLKSFRIPNTYTIAQADQLFIPDSIVDAKGDIITATADNTPARLAVGTNGNVLTAASGETTGLKWAFPGKVLQVTQTNFSTQTSSTSTAYPPTAYFFQGTITPKSTTSTVYCFAVIYRYGTSSGGRQFTDIKYNTTSGDSSGSSLGLVTTHAEQALDSRYSIPAVFMRGVTLNSTSTHYFKVVASHGDRDAAATWYVNPFNDLSSVTLIEVEA